jgi:hypothetical protein
MYTAEIRLVVGACDLNALSDLLADLCACWYKNGQVTLTPAPFA